MYNLAFIFIFIKIYEQPYNDLTMTQICINKWNGEFLARYLLSGPIWECFRIS